MNRAERRKAGITKKPKTYVLTDADIQKIKRDAVDEAFIALLACPCMAARDTFGAGKVRLPRFIDRTITWFELVQDGEVTLAECIETLKNEAKVDITLAARNGIFQRRKNE